MPLIGFGTWNVRGTSGERTILTAIKVGYRLIDSAKMYGNEEIVGSALKKSGVERKEFFITRAMQATRVRRAGSKSRSVECRPITLI